MTGTRSDERVGFRARGGRRALAMGFGLFTGAIVFMTSVWAAGAIYYAPIGHERLRAALAAAWMLSTLLAFVLLRRRGRTFVAYLIALAALLVVWLQIPPSNDRDWQPEVAMTPYVTTAGDAVTVHNVRNFAYRTEADFAPVWETRTYDLRKLDSADLIAVYWAGKAIAHIMLSFGFGGKDYLAVSIETRKEKGESYSTLAGFFRNYELYYVVGDERDVVRVRTTYRNPQEDVYIYRIQGPRENIRRVFLDYMRSVNELRERPQFYNTLLTNCTTSIWLHTRMNRESPPLSWKILLSGYLPDYLYELGRLEASRPFSELEKISRINARAHAADNDLAFSQRIREGLPLREALP